MSDNNCRDALRELVEAVSTFMVVNRSEGVRAKLRDAIDRARALLAEPVEAPAVDLGRRGGQARSDAKAAAARANGAKGGRPVKEK